MLRLFKNTLIILMISTGAASAQEEACFSLIKQCYSQMSEDIQNTSSDKMLYIELETITHYSTASGVGEQREFYTLRATQGKSFLEGKQASVYQDAKHVVTLVKPSQLVIIMATTEEQKGKNPLQNMDLSQLDQMKISSCEEIQEGGIQLMKIVLTSKMTSDQSTLTFYINEDKKAIERLVISGISEEINGIEYHYKTVNKNVPLDAHIKTSALSKVMASNGKLKEPYQSYTLQDLRK